MAMALPAIPAWLSTAMTVASTVMSLKGASDQADATRRAAQQNAENARVTAEANQRQLEYSAGQSEAAGQHEAEAKRRKAELMLSRAQAVSAASGGGPLDESLIAGIVGEGEREAGYSMYTSREQAAGSRYRGKVGMYEANARGRTEIESANRTANATMLGAYAKAGTSLFSRFAPADFPDAGNYQIGTKGYSGNYLEYDA